MKRFGLIGNPVAGSLSPRLFEAAYGGRYTYDLIEGAEFAASWQRFASVTWQPSRRAATAAARPAPPHPTTSASDTGSPTSRTESATPSTSVL